MSLLLPLRLPLLAALALRALLLAGAPAVFLAALAISLAIWSLLRTLAVAHSGRWFAAILALPLVALGAGSVGAVDALGASACLMSLDAAVRRQHAPMLLWLGVGLGLGLAAVLFVPFVAALLLHRRVHPALLLLVPLGLAMTVSLSMATALSGDAPNVACLVASLLPAAAPHLTGLAIVAAFGVAACFVAHFSVRLPSGARVLPVALLATVLMGASVPQTHAGAFLLPATIAGFALATAAERHNRHAALLVQAGFCLALIGNPALGFVAVAVAIWRLVAPAQRAANDNPIMMPALPPMMVVRQPPA